MRIQVFSGFEIAVIEHWTDIIQAVIIFPSIHLLLLEEPRITCMLTHTYRLARLQLDC